MSKITVKIPKGLKTLDDSMRLLSEKPSFERAQSVVNNVISLLGINYTDTWKPFNDSQGKIRSNAGWFMVAEGFADKRAAYKLADNNPQSVDLKCYWMKKLNKSVISWLVALTPNFEDEPFYGSLNIGMDFVIPEEADRVLVVLSKNYVIRTVELQDQLSVTQQEIFNAWLTYFNFANKSQVHEVLWKSFDLEPVNKSFYKGISAFFVELKQYLAEDVEVFDEKHAAYFTNRLTGRIVFCWFLNKKGIMNSEAKYFDIGKLKATEYYREKLEVLFFKVFNTPIEERDFGIDDKTPFLNGGLFEVKDNDKFGDPSLVFPDDYFDRFFQFLRHYNFTTDESTSTFQQVAIDPEMLGRIFENLLAEQVEETGEQARKAKGAFYTPREIVDYMCRESLREYLKTKIPEDEYRDQRIGLLLDVKSHEFRDQQRNYRGDLKTYKYEILKALDEIKIIDPACGSGAFPMGMLHLLLDVYDRLDATFDPYKKKMVIIKNNLFGVDIEPMAVEICRLRVWLSIIVDEEADSKKIEPLPNLDFKFICANSLIPIKGEDSKELFDILNKDELLEIRDKYFNARTLKSKDALKREFEKKIDYNGSGNIFSSEREKQLRSYHPFDSENITQFFDADFMFGVKDGFDVVIGNPPYITLALGKKQKKFTKQEIDKLRKIYSDISEYKDNTFVYFIRCSFRFLNENGLTSFIIPNALFYNKNYSKIRRFILDNSKINVLIDIKGKVFQSAEIGGNGIFIFTKKKESNNRNYNVNAKVIFKGYEFNNIVYDVIESSNFSIFAGNRFRLNIKENNILRKLNQEAIPLENLVEFYNGIKTGNNTKYLLDLKKDDRCELVYRGREIHKYYLDTPHKYVLFDKNLLWSNTNENRLRKIPKILIRQTGDSLIAAIDKKGILHMDTTHSMFSAKNVSLYYILGLINSKLMNWWHKSFTSEEGRTFAEVKISTLKQMPVKIGKCNEIEERVKNILKKKENNIADKIDNLEREIDYIVFDLYGITPDERKTILEG